MEHVAGFMFLLLLPRLRLSAALAAIDVYFCQADCHGMAGLVLLLLLLLLLLLQLLLLSLPPPLPPPPVPPPSSCMGGVMAGGWVDGEW